MITFDYYTYGVLQLTKHSKQTAEPEIEASKGV